MKFNYRCISATVLRHKTVLKLLHACLPNHNGEVSCLAWRVKLALIMAYD